MSQFIDSIKAVKNNYKIYDDWEQCQADDVAKRKYLSEKFNLPKDKVELTKAKALTIFRASDMMDKRSEDNCANMERTTGLISLALTLPIAGSFFYQQNKQNKLGKALSTKQSILFYAVMLIPSIALILWGNSKQKEASRIGRFQAKQHELKDVKNFVTYTPEQIEAAKLASKNIPEKKDKKNLSELLKNMKQISKDKIEYKKWIEQKIINDEEIKKNLNTEFTAKQIEQGNEDKEIIVNIVKDVNLNAEKYSQNVENVFDTIGLLSFVTDFPIYFLTNKVIEKFKYVSEGTKKLAPWLACALFTIPMTLWSTSEKKKGAAIGRFKKRQEILGNPELIMSYSDSQKKLADNIKAPKIKNGFCYDIKENITFFRNYLKDSIEYKNYKKTTEKENKKLYEALKQTNISEEQIKEAKHIQQKTFMAFDKVDEMSQRYSEDTEAATQIVMQLLSPLCTIIGMFIPVAVLYAASKGKFPLNRILKTISNFTLQKNSSIRIYINKVYETINKDKNLKNDFSKILLFKKNKNIIEKLLNNSKLNEHFTELVSKDKRVLTLIKTTNQSEKINILNEICDEHLKQGKISKWLRNLSKDIIKLVADKTAKQTTNQTKSEINPIKLISELYNKYKTLSKTFLYGGFLPFFAIVGGIPFVITSWATNIQLKAGKIGVMKAMDEINNPKLFVKKNDETN